ncbi:MAG TPA: type II 3-dehydroquinate dehydratase [Elusimicrobiota bacterium]|jgi:3-dehydroquinate dehydratase-2|nr:type II 3-dehydroquinate dehydratase [Elusimicrobiota bacterium]
MKRVLVLHGPNLNLLGEREPAVYGTTTLSQVDAMIRKEARRLGLSVRVFQRNGEGPLIDLLHANRKWADGIAINPGAYTHYSYALRDAIAAVAKPAVEVHLSDIAKREAWRRVSVVADVCAHRIMGKGPAGYLEALRWLSTRGSKKA